MNGQQLQRSQSAKYRAPPPPPPPPSLSSIDKMFSSLPETFISSLRQLFSIIDKTNSGYIPFDVFKRYFDCSSTKFDFLNELEIESKSNNNLITFNLLINVIKRSISFPKQPPQPPPQPPIIIPKVRRPLNRSTSVLVVTPKVKPTERKIPIVYRSTNELEMNNSNISNPIYYNQKKQIDFAMIRALKRFEIERNLLFQTCDTLDRVKYYLTDRIIEMKDKQKSYCRHLSTAEATGIATESMYNRDLVADLFKLANTVIEEVNYDYKKSSDYSSTSSSSSSFNGINNQLKAKDDHIQRLETEKRILLKELIEMRHQQGTVIPTKFS